MMPRPLKMKDIKPFLSDDNLSKITIDLKLIEVDGDVCEDWDTMLSDLTNKTYDRLEWMRKEIEKEKKKNVLPFLQKSKIAVLPSYREGLPKTLLEAASCRLPIVTTNVEGCREVCIDNFNGILVPPRDHISLSIAIEKILANSKLANFYGKNGRKLIQDRFSIEIIKKKFLQVYNESLK